MSIFSSLNYLLTRAASAINQTISTETASDEILKDIKNKLSFLNNSESQITNYNRQLPFFFDKSNNSSNLFELGNWTKFIGLSTTSSNPYFGIQNTYKNEYDVRLPNDTYPNAEHLLESWWNIFDARYLRHGWGLTITLIIAYLIMLIVGVIGNVMVILVVYLRPQMRSVTNMFIMNLAVADLFVIVLCVPATLLANIFAPWILGSFMCKAVAYVQGVAVCASAYSLAAISLDRCQAVYRNYERPRGFSWKICVRTVFVIWIAAISFTVPWAVTFEVKVSDYDGLRYCVETWGTEKHGNIYFLVVNFGGFYAIPLLLIFLSNWIIYCHVMHRHVPDDSASSAPLRKMHRDTRRHVLKMLGIVTLTFLISWLPVYVLVIIIKFSDKISEPEYNVLKILMPIAQWFGSWNSSMNPILYAFLNKKFRKMFKSILPSWFPVKVVEKYVASHKTPNFTTAYTVRNLERNGTVNSQYQKNIIGGFEEHSGTKRTNTNTSSRTMSTSVSPVYSICSSESILVVQIPERTKVDFITNL